MSSLQELFGIPFDTHSVAPAEDFVAVPPDKYPVVVEKAEVKTTKKGDGHYIELTLTILDGQYKNRKVWDRINIHNPNAQCVEIGLRSLAALGQAIGLASISATEQLINQVCIAHVKVKDGSNEVRTYSAVQGYVSPSQPVTQAAPVQQPPFTTPAPGQTMQAPTQQQTSPAAAFKPPWAK